MRATTLRTRLLSSCSPVQRPHLFSNHSQTHHDALRRPHRVGGASVIPGSAHKAAAYLQPHASEIYMYNARV